MIVNASFEERSSYGIRKLLQQYSVEIEQAFILIFEETSTEEKRHSREEQLNYIRSLLQEHCDGVKIHVVQCMRKSPLDGIGQLEQYLDRKCDQNPNGLIDISTLTRFYLLELLRLLQQKKGYLNNATLLYTSVKYGSGKLTKGVRNITTMPHFRGYLNPSLPTTLISFLGFESDRALGVLEEYEPELTFGLITDPPEGLENYEERAREENKLLLSRPGVKTIKIPAYKPKEVNDRLNMLYQQVSETRKELNFVVVALGTKPQTLGLYDFWSSHRDIRITYAYPEKYMGGWKTRSPQDVLLYNMEEGHFSRLKQIFG